jgi:hypothetical protein
MKITEIDLTFDKRTPPIHSPYKIHDLNSKIIIALRQLYYDEQSKVDIYCLHLKFMQIDFVLQVWHELHQINDSLVHCGKFKDVQVVLNDLQEEEAIGYFLKKIANEAFSHLKIKKISIINSRQEKDYDRYMESFQQQNIAVTFFADEETYLAAIVEPAVSEVRAVTADAATKLLPTAGLFSGAPRELGSAMSATAATVVCNI